MAKVPLPKNTDSFRRYLRVAHLENKKGPLPVFETDYAEFRDIKKGEANDKKALDKALAAEDRLERGVQLGSRMAKAVVKQPLQCSALGMKDVSFEQDVLQKELTLTARHEQGLYIVDIPTKDPKVFLTVGFDSIAFFWHFEAVV